MRRGSRVESEEECFKGKQESYHAWTPYRKDIEPRPKPTYDAYLKLAEVITMADPNQDIRWKQRFQNFERTQQLLERTGKSLSNH